MSGPQRDETGRLIQFRGAPDSPDCQRCPCARDGRPEKSVRASGATGGLAIVGEGPGAEEVFQGWPFIGPSGKLINRALGIGGIDRALLWITNALLCARPREDSLLEKAVECCRPRLAQELQSVGPSAILAFGGTAMRSLQLPVSGVSDGRGTVQQTPLCSGVPVFSTIHPAALLRGGAGDVSGGKNKQNVDAQMLFFQADIEKAHKVSIGEILPYWSDDIEAFVPAQPIRARVPEPAAAAVAPDAPPAKLDAVTEMVKAKFDQAFIDYYVANQEVWELLKEIAAKGKPVRASTDMIWGVVGFKMIERGKAAPPDGYKPFYLRMLAKLEPDLV